MLSRARFIVESARGLLFVMLVSIALPLVLLGHVAEVASRTVPLA